MAAFPLLRELHASHNHIRDLGPLCLHEHLEVRRAKKNNRERAHSVHPYHIDDSMPITLTLTLTAFHPHHEYRNTQVLDLAANPVASLAALDLLASLPRLHSLSLQGTPLRAAVVQAAGQGEEKEKGKERGQEGEARYRALVAALLPRLLLLDGRKLCGVTATAGAAAAAAATEGEVGNACVKERDGCLVPDPHDHFQTRMTGTIFISRRKKNSRPETGVGARAGARGAACAGSQSGGSGGGDRNRRKAAAGRCC